MSVKERDKWGAILAKWVPFFIITCTFLGIVLGSILVYFFQGEFPYEVLAGGLVGTSILVIFEAIRQKRKKDRLPEIDERIAKNVSRLFAYASHISLAILFIILGIFTLLGYESIPIYYLWIIFFSYIWVGAIGVFFIKRR